MSAEEISLMQQELQTVRERVVTLENALWGANRDNGLNGTLKKLEKAIEELKAFQLRFMGGGAVAFFLLDRIAGHFF